MTQHSHEKEQPATSTGFFQGRVSHARFFPKTHRFSYRYFYLWLALDQWSQVQQQRPEWFRAWPGWARFRRRDYMGDPKVDLADYVRQIAGLEQAHDNPVWMLGQLRYLGIYFSPVNFYFIGPFNQFHTLVAEVSNTPWGEKHSYLVPLTENGPRHFQHPKAFQVSPFMNGQQQYRWTVRVEEGQIHIAITSTEAGQRIFQASMSLQQKTMNQTTIPRVLMTSVGWMLSTKVKIYWQALKLLLKGIPFIGHTGLKGNQTDNSLLSPGDSVADHKSKP